MDSRKLSSMTTKQKVMAVAIVLILMLVAWQVIGMFGQTPPAPDQSAFQTTTPKGAAPAAMTAGTPQGQPQPVAQQPAVAQAAMPPQQPQIRQEDLKVSPNDILSAQSKVQENYINALNQLQMLRIEREIAETNQAISAAKLATVKAEKSVSDLLAKPTPEAPLPQSAYFNRSPDSTAGATAPAPANTPPPPIQEVADVPYVVVSVSMQMNRWSAVLGYKGDLYTVSTGDILSVDGSKVVSINKNSVILQKNGKRRRLNLTGQI